MVNRIENYLNQVRLPPPSTDYWWAETRESAYFVSASTARALRRALKDERGEEENPWEDGDHY